MSDYRWMTDLCSPDAGRVQIGRPFLTTFRGETVTVATDGRVMLMVRGVHAGAEGGASFDRMVAPTLARVAAPTRAVPVDLDALKAFLRTDEIPTLPCTRCGDEGTIPCAACDGVGEFGECECLSCGHVHERECTTCRGGGRIACPDCQGYRERTDLVVLGGDFFNRALVAPALRRLAAPAAPLVVTWSQERREGAALLDGDEWRLLLMPMRPGWRKTSGIPAFPIAGCVSPLTAATSTTLSGGVR